MEDDDFSGESTGTVGIGAFAIGMFIASFTAGIVGAVAGLGFWSCVGLAVSVMIVSQLLYVGVLMVVSAARARKLRRNRTKTDHGHGGANALNGNNVAPK
ncbi:hypothetical protein [Phaeovulum sp.]|uniref:hypothetical protein n=1 Tax=Phaeovulum sp. TaxID=2934796 RepID=UPI0039E21B68